MKKMIVILSMLILTTLLSAQERFSTVPLETNGESRVWSITSTADDTSETFNLFYHTGIQYCFNDTAGVGGDSVRYKIELLASTVDIDSTFKLYQTISADDSVGGYRPIKIITTFPAVRFGKIIVTGITKNTTLPSLVGRIYVTGWSNAEGMSGKLR